MPYPLSLLEQVPSLAVDFDAASESYSFGDLAAVPSSDVDFTVESWCYFTTLAGWKEYAGKANGALGWYLLATFNGSSAFAIAFDDARTAPLGITQVVNTWTYHCWVHNATANTVQGYYGVDGGALITGTLTSAIAGPTASTGSMRVGSQDPFPTDGGIVRIAFVRVWSAALSEPQLQLIWNKRFLPGESPFPNLAFHWDANLDAGTAPIDYVSGTVGTLIGTPTIYFTGPALDWIVPIPEWLLEVVASGTTYTQSVAGTLTGSGALLKRTGKLAAGTLTGSGALTKQTAKSPAGTLTGSGSLIKQTRKALTGTLTGSGVLIKQTQKALTGILTGSGSLLKQANKAVAGILTGSGSLTKQTRKSFGGTLSGSGTLSAIRTFLVAVGGTLTSAGTLLKQVRKPLVGTLSSAGTLIKQTRKSLAGTLTGSGALSTVKVFLMAVGGTLTSAGTLLKQTRKGLAGTLTGSGLLTKQTRKPLAGGLAGSGALTKQIQKLTSGTLTSAGSLTKRIAKSLGGVLSGSGLLVAIKSGGASIIGLVKALFAIKTPGANLSSGTPGADIDAENE